MQYVKNYNLIAQAVLQFEQQGRDFYEQLLEAGRTQPIHSVLEELRQEKSAQVDMLSGMVAVSSFVLADVSYCHYNTSDVEQWLDIHLPVIYTRQHILDTLDAEDPAHALDHIQHVENCVLRFYHSLMKKMPMNIGQVEALIFRQKETLARIAQAKGDVLHVEGDRNQETDESVVDLQVVGV